MTDSTAEDNNTKFLFCRPFLKWAGGKTQLLPELMHRIPEEFNNYYEPFCGRGALFYELQPVKAYISDINEELINSYIIVRDKVEDLIKSLSKHVYESNYFYKLRNLDRALDYKNWSNIEKASRLIYLNKTCFNGLYRVNSKGEFNVPFGRYTNPKICDSVNLRACSQALKGVSIDVSPFETIVAKAQAGDFVYFDPPYAPLSATSNFTSYSKDKFDLEMQVKLRDVCDALDKKKVKFMLSNSSAPLVLELYKDYTVEKVAAVRAINSKASNRGEVLEVIVRNYGAVEK